MKHIFLIPINLLLVHSLACAQHKTPSPSKIENIPHDTSITKDPSVPGKEYWIIRNAEGIVLQQGAYLKSKKEGLWREYTQGNGVLTFVEEYKNGLKNGARITYSPVGRILADETYKNDLLDGIRIEYHTNTHMRLLENYEQGLLGGLKRSYYEDNTIQEEGNYLHGQRNGKNRWYRKNGNLSLEYTYKAGDLNGPSKEYDEDGKILREGNYLNNEQEGEWKEYETGVLKKKVIYKAGKIISETNVKQ